MQAEAWDSTYSVISDGGGGVWVKKNVASYGNAQKQQVGPFFYSFLFIFLIIITWYSLSCFPVHMIIHLTRMIVLWTACDNLT